MSESTEYSVRAIERALQILKSFDDLHPERGVSEIAEVVGLHKATTHRILATLMNFGFIERSPDGLKYRLGLELIDLGFKVTRRMDLRREALPYLQKLAVEINEAVDLSIWDQTQVLYVEMIQSNHALTVSASVGQRLPAYCTASGNLFLANLPEEELSRNLQLPMQSFTKNTIVDPVQLKKILQRVKEDGFAIDCEGFEYGVSAVAAPIINQQNRVVAAVSIPGPASRLTPERMKEITPALVRTTRDISRRLGWNM
jgi:IclR family transcriptional regulator, KDG regulon repressor